MPHRLQLSLESERGPEQLADLVRELAVDLRKERDFDDVKEATRLPHPNERAAEIGVLGQLGLTFLSAGAATALIGCLKAYIERDHTLRFRIKRPDGSELELEGKHLEGKDLKKTVATLKQFVT